MSFGDDTLAPPDPAQEQLAKIRRALKADPDTPNHTLPLLVTAVVESLRLADAEVKRTDLARAVREFHEAFDIERSSAPTACGGATRALRYELIREELQELNLAYQSSDLEKIADALGDLLYVVVGAFVTHGLDMQGVFNEIHRSNMTKAGGHKREDGKWMKPPTYSPPALKRFCVLDAPAGEGKP